MIYRTAPRIGVALSLLSMGGHEYLPDGRSRGFNEDMGKATRTPGYLFDGFGGPARQETLRVAYQAGINFFDVTQDTEKDALRRNLAEMPPPYEIFVQTRPEGMCYSYDEFNRGLIDYGKLKAEVQRSLRLLGRDHIDFLNFGILRWALDYDAAYLAKLRDNIERLKREGLIRWASADTFSGEHTFLRMIESDAFNSCNLNFNCGDWGASREVIPAAHAAGMAVFVREAFLKGRLFSMAAEADIADRAALAAAALRWCLAFSEVTSLTIGTGNPSHLAGNLAVANDIAMSARDHDLIAMLREKSPGFREFEAQRSTEYFARGEVPTAASTGEPQ